MFNIFRDLSARTEFNNNSFIVSQLVLSIRYLTTHLEIASSSSAVLRDLQSTDRQIKCVVKPAVIIIIIIIIIIITVL